MKFVLYIFLLFVFFPCISFSQGKFDFYISNTGNDANPGTSELLPKRTLSATQSLLKQYADKNGNVSIGLNQGSVFNDMLYATSPLQVGTYSDNSNNNNFTILNGSDEFNTGWIKEASTLNIYKRDITLSGFTGNGINGIGQYSFVYVTEIDKQLEKTEPFTARKLLQFVSRKGEADSLPGTFYEQLTFAADSPITVFIHTSDGSSPNLNSRYRYEVTVRGRAISASKYNSRFENLWVMGYGAGQGMLTGGSDSYYNKIIFGPGAAIHHVVLASGTINNSLFLPGPKNTDDGAVIFYDVEGLGRACYIQNTIFMDISTPIYMHTSYGTNYGLFQLDKVTAFADSTQGGLFMNTSNNDSVILNNLYTDKYTSAYANGSPKYLTINNSCFKDIVKAVGFSPNPVNAFLNNIFIRQKGPEFGSAISLGANTSLQLTNSIVHMISIQSDPNNGDRATNFILGTGGASNHIKATGNIFICDVNTHKALDAAVTNTDNGIGTSTDIWDNNVYVLLKGTAIYWTVTNIATNGGTGTVPNFKEWQRQSGQDKNSLFFDLRNDSRGLKAIFIDPDNGDYELANTSEANQIRALKAGMTVPLTCFLSKPTYEEAANMIKNGITLTANSCTNPCVQGSIRGGSYLNAQLLNNGQVQLQWSNTQQLNIDHYEIERASFASPDYSTIASIPVSSNSTYYYTDDNIPAGGIYNYRLAVIANNEDKCHSYISTITVTAGSSTTSAQQNISISPNPTSGKINVSLNHFNGAVNLMVLNNVGQKIVTKKINVVNMISVPLDVSGQPTGSYWLKIESSNGTSNVQLFILQ